MNSNISSANNLIIEMIVKIIYFLVVIYVHDEKKFLDEKRILSGISRDQPGTSDQTSTYTSTYTSTRTILGRRLGGTTRPIFK